MVSTVGVVAVLVLGLIVSLSPCMAFAEWAVQCSFSVEAKTLHLGQGDDTANAPPRVALPGMSQPRKPSFRT